MTGVGNELNLKENNAIMVFAKSEIELSTLGNTAKNSKMPNQKFHCLKTFINDRFDLFVISKCPLATLANSDSWPAVLPLSKWL